MKDYLADRTAELDLKIATSMLNRAEILSGEDIAGRTDVSVQELINLVCNLLDGERDWDIKDKVGVESADRVLAIRDAIKPLWTHRDGTKVLG